MTHANKAYEIAVSNLGIEIQKQIESVILKAANNGSTISFFTIPRDCNISQVCKFLIKNGYSASGSSAGSRTIKISCTPLN